jgi:hypothetical protein
LHGIESRDHRRQPADRMNLAADDQPVFARILRIVNPAGHRQAGWFKRLNLAMARKITVR